MTPSVAESTVFAYLRQFLLAVLPAGTPVVQGQANQVAEPHADNYVVFTPLTRKRLSTTVQTWDLAALDPTQIVYTEPTQIDVQLDVHGGLATDNVQRISTTLRSPFGCDYFAGTGIAPLYCDDGHQMPFTNGEGLYEDRWTIAASLQVNPSLSTPQQFADTLTAGVVEIDSRYPPGA